MFYPQNELEWGLGKSKIFTTKSLYRFITNRGVVIAEKESIWKTKLPLKIKIFLWQLANNKLQASTVLKKRGWKGDIHCCLCGRVETVNHIFFQCSMAQFVWCCVRIVFGLIDSPASWSDLRVGVGSARYGSAHYGSTHYGSLRYRAEILARLGSARLKARASS
jgi:hypothetical protein